MMIFRILDRSPRRLSMACESGSLDPVARMARPFFLRARGLRAFTPFIEYSPTSWRLIGSSRSTFQVTVTRRAGRTSCRLRRWAPFSSGVFVSLAVGGGAVRVDLAAGDLKNVIATPKGAFAAMNGADVMADYLTQAGKLTPAAVIEDFRLASTGKRFED